MDFTELQSQMEIYNLVYYFLNRPVRAVETKEMADVPIPSPLTIPPRPEKGEEDGE